MEKTKLLFVTWDGPRTTYMEGLFMPIFDEIKKSKAIEFHVLQFTWKNPNEINVTKEFAEKLGIKYESVSVIKKPVAAVGSLITLLTGSKIIKNYILKNRIDFVVPRSTFPAFMVSKIKGNAFKIIFDADGLPIEERVDFAGLKPGSQSYQWFKSIETKMLKKADVVLTRAQKAIDIHIKNIGESYRSKFFVVSNGKDKNQFRFDANLKKEARKQLGIEDNIRLFVYSGSLGPQYAMPEMLEIFETYQAKSPSHFLILTGNKEFAEQLIPAHLKQHISLLSVSAQEVPFYINTADVAFGLREPSFSMQGVAPIKLGEYLLCGLPVLASKGIGDSEELLNQIEGCLLYDHALGLAAQMDSIMSFIDSVETINKEKIREKAEELFSLEASAESYKKALEFVGI